MIKKKQINNKNDSRKLKERVIYLPVRSFICLLSTCMKINNKKKKGGENYFSEPKENVYIYIYCKRKTGRYYTRKNIIIITIIIMIIIIKENEELK